MKSPFASHATGWIVLTALIAFFPQLAGCDSTAPSQKKGDSTNDTVPAPLTDEAGKASQQEGLHSKAPPATTEDKDQGDLEKGAADRKSAEGTTQDSAASDEAPFVKRLVIASDIQEREPIEIEGAKVKDPVVAFLELKHSGKEESGVVVTFEHESGKKVGFVELKVPAESPRFRTWARTRNISEAGEWTAIIRSKAGDELARKSFTVAG